MHTLALISFLMASPVDATPALQIDAPAIERQTTDQSPVILKTQARRRRTQTKPPALKNRRRVGGPILSAFWTVFAPPGDYHYEIGAAGGIDFLETAYGGSNPNAIYQVHFALRPTPSLPLQALATVDYSNYEQNAGDLTYNSRYVGGYLGAGAVYWIGGLRLNADAGLGGLLRMASQSDGDGNDFTTYAFSPAAIAGAGMGISVLGHVAITAKAQARLNTPYRVSYNVLFGLDWMIDANPPTFY